MFKGKKRPINPNTTDTLIGEGTNFEGRIKSEASIRIEGHITGDVECTGDVTVGEKGSVKSNISARDIIIAGTVTGNIVTKGKLTITSTGSLHGNISATSFIIDEGGIFQGTSKMDTKPLNGSGSAKESENETGNKPYSSNASYSASSIL
jgi:cytoskeletal protein CcmA (bactofilin family)